MSSHAKENKNRKSKCAILSNNKNRKTSVLFLAIKNIIYEARFEVRQYNFLLSAVSEFF